MYSVLHSLTEKKNAIVFFDLEGTQFSHKMIAISMVGFEIVDSIHTGKKLFEYFSYVNSNDEVGNTVTKITGIDSSLLKEKGKNINDVIYEINILLRPYHRLFISYGNHDLYILKNSLESNETMINFFRNIKNNYLDFHAYLEKRIVNEKGTSYSIQGLLDLFSIKMNGTFHNPKFDSLCLKEIYEYYTSNPEKMANLSMMNIINNKDNKKILTSLTEYLIDKGSVNKDYLFELVKENL